MQHISLLLIYQFIILLIITLLITTYFIDNKDIQNQTPAKFHDRQNEDNNIFTCNNIFNNILILIISIQNVLIILIITSLIKPGCIYIAKTSRDYMHLILLSKNITNYLEADTIIPNNLILITFIVNYICYKINKDNLIKYLYLQHFIAIKTLWFFNTIFREKRKMFQ